VNGWFVHPTYLALGGLVALPIIIHLLFRVRPPVVRWPAMDFLLAALKKTRRRTRFEQLILLALRMFGISAAVLLIARPQLVDDISAILESGPAAEHVVVLDDTLSMGEIADGETAFAVGVRSIDRLAERLSQRPGRNRFAVVPTSRPAEYVLSPAPLDQERAASLRGMLENAKPTFVARAPDEALAKAVDTLLSSDAVVRVLHVVSDFRRRDWPADGAAIRSLRRAAAGGVHVRLIDASAGDAANIGIERIESLTGPAAVGVPIEVQATVVNHSDRTAENVPVEYRLDGVALPKSIIPSIAPGGRMSVKSWVTAEVPGSHAFSAKVPLDVLPADNERWLALDVVDRAPVLIVDGDERQREGRFIAAALDPGGSARTGWAPTLRSFESLRASGFEGFRLVIFVNVPEFKADDAKAIANYLAQGGSVCWFVGDSTSKDGWKSLNTANVLPAELRARETLVAPLTGPEVLAAGEFLRGLAKSSGSFLDAVSVNRRFSIGGPSPEGAEVLLKSKDGKPLVLSRRVGRGKTAMVLTSAGPTWNNWATNPSYVVFLLELGSYLTARSDESTVGERWSLALDVARYRRTGSWWTPTNAAAEQPLSVEPAAAGATMSTPRIDEPGVYQMTLQTQSGEREVRSRAFNVDAAEGELQKVAPNTFSKGLDGLAFRMERAGMEDDDGPSRNLEIRDLLLLLLIATLFAEQAWARRYGRRV